MININHILIKIFSNKIYAQNFIEKGELHFETFEWFRNQSKIDKNRGDEFEGLKSIKLNNNQYLYNYQNEYDSLISFFAFPITEFEKTSKLKQINSIKSEILCEKMLEFGDHAVLINTKLFIEKINQKMKGKAIGDFVKYIPEFKTNKEYDVFTKISNNYNHQKEFRIVNKNLELDGNNNFYIGNLQKDNIATYTETINLSEVELKFK